MKRFYFIRLGIPMLSLIFLLLGCRGLKVIPASEVEKDPGEGFYYVLPKTELFLEFTLLQTTYIKGKYSDYTYLLNQPVGERTTANMEVLKLLEIKGYSFPVPDTSKIFFVRTDLGNKKLFKENLYLDFSFPGSISTGSSPMEPVKIFPSVSQVTLVKTGDKPIVRKKNRNDFAEETLEEGLRTLIKENKKLIADLYKMPATANEDTLRIRLRNKVDSIHRVIKGFEYQAEEMVELFNTYRGEDIARKAKLYADVIHKLIELKTELAGGKSDIEYTGVPIGEMVAEINSMIDRYQQAFKGEEEEKTITFRLHLKPDKVKTVFRFSLEKDGNNEYYIKESTSPGDLNLTIKFPGFGTGIKAPLPEKENRGLYYNIPASSEILVDWGARGSQVRNIATGSIILPQMGTVATLPTKYLGIKYVLDERTGALKKIESGK